MKSITGFSWSTLEHSKSSLAGTGVDEPRTRSPCGAFVDKLAVGVVTILDVSFAVFWASLCAATLSVEYETTCFFVGARGEPRTGISLLWSAA